MFVLWVCKIIKKNLKAVLNIMGRRIEKKMKGNDMKEIKSNSLHCR